MAELHVAASVLGSCCSACWLPVTLLLFTATLESGVIINVLVTPVSHNVCCEKTPTLHSVLASSFELNCHVLAVC